jgi:hypothetical protein
LHKKSTPAEAEALFSISVLVVAVALEALAAVHGAVALGLEGHLGGAAAAIADHFVVLALGAAGILAVAASGAALMATGGVVLEALVRKELLLRRAEHKFLATVTAYQSLVFEHGWIPSTFWFVLSRICFESLAWFPCFRTNSKERNLNHIT